MLSKFAIAIAIIAGTSVLPTPSRPRTTRLSRGPAWTDFQALAVDDAAVEEAKQIANGRRRLAVVAVTDSSASDAADVAAEVIRSGLRYSQHLIVVDAMTSRTLFGSKPDIPNVRAVCQKNNVDEVVLVQVNSANKTLALAVVDADQAATKDVAPAQLENLGSAVIDSAVEARKTLLNRGNMLPSKYINQIGRRPQATFAAIQHFITARRLLSKVVQENDATERKRICRDAITSADLAIAASPNYLEAYLIKASCQDELDQTLELKRTLTTAFQKSDPPEHDALALLELKGDYARFLKTNPEDALDAYSSLLEIDPTNLTGLWTIIDILLSGEGGAEVDEETIEAAAMYAARLVAFHPQSGVAKAIMAKE